MRLSCTAALLVVAGMSLGGFAADPTTKPVEFSGKPMSGRWLANAVTKPFKSSAGLTYSLDFTFKSDGTWVGVQSSSKGEIVNAHGTWFQTNKLNGVAILNGTPFLLRSDGADLVTIDNLGEVVTLHRQL
ncbi:MAG: hypothetical protein ACTHM6_18480 [Tepidisphaeraceae bacterium]